MHQAPSNPLVLALPTILSRLTHTCVWALTTFLFFDQLQILRNIDNQILNLLHHSSDNSFNQKQLFVVIVIRPLVVFICGYCY